MGTIKHVDLDTLANVVSAIPSNIFLKDTDLKYIFSSHIWEQVDCGDDEDFDIYGKTDRDIRKDTANIDNVEISDRKILETGIGTRYTIKSVVDGHTQYLELVKEPVRDNDGNIIGIVGLINDVTSVTQEMSDMLENEKAYREAMKLGAHLAYEVNLSKDILEDDLVEEIDGKEVNLLDFVGMKSPCCYSAMTQKYAEVMLVGSCQQKYIDFHNVDRLIELFNQGQREVVKEFKLKVNSGYGVIKDVWSYETVLLMRNTKGEIIAFFTVNDITEKRQKEEDIKRQLEENVKEAERVANMKSDFLANMSHEIRTPMNAVIGMAELALREELPPAARDYINQIRTSGNALLNIINDILDFSKIESGKMDIIPDNYNPISLIHDVSGILMNRIGEKDLEFMARINPDLPAGIYGDSMRIRQIVINLANNAIKFTQKGYVRVDVDFDKNGEDEIMLKVSVIDTGIGIKEEDLDKLFVSFQQVDSKRNRNIEGTGLGLAICAKLVELMGGTVSVSSEYGKGSVFSFEVPQKIVDWTPSLSVKDNENKIVVGCWDSEAIHDVFYDVLDRLNTENHLYNDVESIEIEHIENTEGKKVYFLTDGKMYTEKLEAYVDEHPEIQFVVLCDFATKMDAFKPNVLIIKKPFSTVGIGMALNNERFHNLDAEMKEFKFVAPDARVMIVDDSEVNLAVAEGLIEPLNMQVTTVNSGKKALDMLEKQSFDLVFMDHMMPELDGVETTRIIRRLHPELDSMPIIALTANAVGGAKEMFLSEGMNDFVAKPIEIKTIISKIRQWLPAEKIQKSTGEKIAQPIQKEPEKKLSIADFDIDSALALIGNQKLYMTILEKYYEAMKTKAELIKNCEASEDIKTYTIEVHALKSASKQIGAMELSAMAAELEACGNAGDIAAIHEKTDALIEKYLGYYDVLDELFGTKEVAAKSEIDEKLLSEYLEKMLAAADELDLDAMELIMSELDKFRYEGTSQEYYEQLKEATSNIDIEGVAQIIANWGK